MLVFLGVGKFFGSNLAGFIASINQDGADGSKYNWSRIFNTTGVITAIITLLFILWFRDKKKYDLNETNG